MGLKGYRLWAMGQLDSTCEPHPARYRLYPPGTSPTSQRPKLHLKSKRLETRISHFRFKG
jgi:hypothetical protein